MPTYRRGCTRRNLSRLTAPPSPANAALFHRRTLSLPELISLLPAGGDQPLDQLAGIAFVRHVKRCPAVVSDPVHVGTTIEKVFRDLSLSTATRVPECIRDLLGCRRWCLLAESVHTVHEPQRRGLPYGCRRPTLEEPPCGAPLGKHNGV